MLSIIETIATWSTAQTGFSPRAQELAKHAIADTIGCMFAGRNDFSSRAAKGAFAGYLSNGAGALTVGGDSSNAAVAALINATAAHALDYDDNFLPGMSHASAVLVPALLATAQVHNFTGQALIDAYLIGLQAQAFIGNGVGSSHYTAGWHGTSTIGCIGTAAGVAWLIGLDAAGIARSLSNAVSLASGTKGQFGTPIKPLHAGFGARNAVDAALLAKTGMTGRLDILECPQGFRELFGGSHPADWNAGAITATRDHVIETTGVIPKRHPCCGSTHLVVDALLDLKQSHAFGKGDVVSIDTTVGISNWRNLAYPEPRDEMQARFSMQYCVAAMLDKGALNLADFTPHAVADNTDRHLMQRISMVAYSEEQELASPGKLPHMVAVTLSDGRVLTASRLEAKGSLGDAFTDGDRKTKFQDCCGQLGDAEAIYERLSLLEKEPDIGFLAPVFAV